MQYDSVDAGRRTASPPDTPTQGARSNDATAVGLRTFQTGGIAGELSEFHEDVLLMNASGAKMATVDMDLPIMEDNEEQSPMIEANSHVISQDHRK